MQSHWLNHWLQVAVMTALMSLTLNPRTLPQLVTVMNLELTRHLLMMVKNIMAAIHSHDSEGPMGWIGKGINTLSKALTGVLSKEDGQVT